MEWTCQIIVIDNGSTDRTLEIAQRYGALILSAPPSPNFDAFRNLAIDHAIGDWIFYLDSDERVPAPLGPLLNNLVLEHGHEFAALSVPFKNYFCGKWMQHCGWWPGYSRPQLLKKGAFRYNERLHSGVQVDGKSIFFPADDPNLAITHYSYDDLTHYLTKLNNYTDGEEANLYSDGAGHSWQAMLAHFVQDWAVYYGPGQAHRDGMHGYVLAFLSAFYRFTSRAKLWELRRQRGEVDDREPVPSSVSEMLTFMAHVVREGPAHWLQTPHHSLPPSALMPADWLSSAAEDTQPAAALPKDLNHKLTACILARNEEARIEDALKSLQGWTDQTIVIDNDSTDQTAAIARRYGALVLTAPVTIQFEALRNLAIDHSVGDWIFYLDADERVLPALGPALRRLIHERGQDFDALCIPFKNHFYGKWMQSRCWWPGYKGPQLYRKGSFRYGDRVHSSARVDGKVLNFPFEDPHLAITHLAYEDIRRYLTKINHYTLLEAEGLYEDGVGHSWQAMLAYFVYDWQIHYDHLQAKQDGMHGFVQAFLCAFYRFASRAKLWDLRRQRDGVDSREPVPGSLPEMLEFMARVVREGPEKWLRQSPAAAPPVERLPLVWQGPVFDASGYASDGRDLVLSLIQAGEPLALVPERWGDEVALPGEDRSRLDQRRIPAMMPAELLVSNTLPLMLRKSDTARFQIARTVFETDRLPAGWEAIFNGMDRIWVHSAFNKETFARSGVDLDKIAVIPESIDSARFAAESEPWPLPGNEPFKFLSLFDWSLHKGWDVLLEAFARAFGDNPQVGLFLKTWSSSHYSLDDIRSQADAHLRAKLNRGLADFPNIHIWQEALSATDMPRLYRSVDCFVIPTRCEGWCRPLMEAMAAGLPTIATAWGGQTAFHNAQVGYPLPYELVPVSHEGARELPIYAGHFWAEPSPSDLQRLMKHVVSKREAARKKGQAARKSIARRYDRSVVAEILQKEIAYCRELARSKPASAASSEPAAQAGQPGSDAILIQSASGEHTNLLKLTHARHEAYARSHNIDFVCRFGPQQEQRPATWDKIFLILQALRAGQWEHIVWLDADTLIVDRARDLRTALPDNIWLGMVKHGQPPWFNAGAIYIRNTPESRAFFEEVWNTWPVEHHWEDNMAIIRVLGFDPARWRGVAVIGDEWNSTRLMNMVENAVVKGWHGNGTVGQRAAMIQAELQGLTEQSSTQASTRQSQPQRSRSNPLQLAPPAPVDFRKVLGRPLRVRWEGDQNVLSSLAYVNRELCLGLLAAGDVELSITMREDPRSPINAASDPRFAELFACASTPLSGPPDVTVRHHFPPNWQPVETGKLVVIQPWENSHLPEREWVNGAIHHADEIWANSRFVRDVYVRSGVPAEKVALLPHGVRTNVFTPEGPKLPLPTGKTTRFLFVGGTLPRKGADLLLQAYLRAFTAEDDVCLIVKDMGTQTFYRGQNLAEAFQRAQADPAAPEILYFDNDFSEAQLAALYRSASCVVLPYRGEGFGLAPFEGMACGVPPIVTAGGPTDDYVADSFGLRVPSRHIPIPSLRDNPKVLPFEYSELEPDMGALIEAFRWIYQHPEEAQRRGREARDFILNGWTWERSVGIVRERMRELVVPEREQPTVPVRLWSEPARTKSTGTGKTRKAAKRPLISLCMIVRDEEARLQSCLESIRPYVDEMIVLDTGSVDRTREIARDCGARVFEFPWVNSFAEARNRSIEQAKGEWIFWMDADDVISPECGAKLRELAQRHPKRDAAYQVQVHIPPGPGEFSPTVVDHVKLFPNRPEFRFEHRIHEQILPSLRRGGIEILFSDVYVTHQHYDRSPEGQEKKRHRDFLLLRLDLQERPDHPFVLFNFGMTYLYAAHEYEVAAQFLYRSIRRSYWQDSIVRKAYALLTTARICQQDWQAAVVANEEGRSHYPDDAELLFQAGQIYQNLDRHDQAHAALQRLIHQEEDRHFSSVDIGLRTYRGPHELALLHRRLGNLAECERILRDIVERYPHYEPARQDLTEVLIGQGKHAPGQALPPPGRGAHEADRAAIPQEGSDNQRAVPHVPDSAGPIDLAIVTVKREDDYFHATLTSMQPSDRVDVVVGSVDADYLDRYRTAGRLCIHQVDPEEWETRKDLVVQQRASWNYWRGLALTTNRDRGIAIFEDDVRFGTAWRHRLEQVVQAAEEVYGDNFVLSLYCPYGFFAEGDNRGKLICEYPIDIFAGTQGMYYPAKLRHRFAEYLKAHGVDSYRIPYDFLLKEFLVQEGIPLLTTSPSLVQHVGHKTTGLGFCHISPFFLGEEQ
ncbi:MAG: hypothetical protein JWL77_5868 [Chthonomonadaceae bacterium]|nr:hypothetical protein [Chthonomonadaceae bacterium]